VRPALRAAFERARDLRLTAAEVASALAPAVKTPGHEPRGRKG
jgi:hypothetical protein